MKFNNLEDKFLDKLNDLNQTDPDVNSGNYIIIPRASNNANSIFTYYQRKNYGKYLNNKLKDTNVSVDTFKDFFYKDNLYGKINTLGNSISINKENLKTLNDNPNFYLSNVAADAFNEMMLKYNAIIDSGLILKTSKFYKIKVKKAYSSPHIEYNDYLNTYLNKFFNFITNNNLKNNITDYSSTIKNFIFYYNSQYDNFLFNKGEFIKSGFSSSNISGLIVEFDMGNYGDDFYKYQKFFEDPSFLAFQNLAKEFGFTIDKNIPWRMVFDISSPSASRYLINNYSIQNIEEYFNNYYYIADYFDFENFKVNMYNLYSFIAEQEPEFKIANYRLINNKVCISQKTVRRNRFDYSDLNKFIDEKEMLKIFFYIKSKENNFISTENQFEQEFNEILQVYKYKDIISALDLIFFKCKVGYDRGDKQFIMNFF
jgi:hypothetical protein